MENIEENWEESSLKQIGARVPGVFAEKFAKYCRKKPVNQRKLFYYLTKWWFEQDVLIQEHISHGRMQEALLQISEEARGRSVVRRAKVQKAQPTQKQARKSSKSA